MVSLACTLTTKNPGENPVPSWILRDHALTLHPICTIINVSIREGYLPAIWRSAIVIPIPKVNPLRIISKVIGGWMLDYIVDRLDVNQYGGLRGLSTTHALVDMVHTWLLTAEERKASHVVLLDYRKAFDHVDHQM